MNFPNLPQPGGIFAWLIYLLMVLVGIWVIFQIVPAIATFIANLG